MKKYNILVTGTSSYGVGEGMLKVINNSIYRNDIKLIGASNSNLTAFKNIVDGYYILPSANDYDYIDSLNKLLKKENIDILIPGSEAEMKRLSKDKELVIDDVDLWVNDYSIIQIFDDKRKANEFFCNNLIKTPKVYEKNSIHEMKFPVVIKPTKGKSSEGIYIAESIEQLQAIENLNKMYNRDSIIQEYINLDAEYTVSLINLDNKQQEIFIMKRILNKGATQYAEYCENQDVRDVVLNIHNKVQTELILNIQLAKKNDEYFVIEINPRFSGSAPIRSLMGFNEFDIIFTKTKLNTRLNYQLKKTNFVIRGYMEFIF